jgi:hypothetical protein
MRLLEEDLGGACASPPVWFKALARSRQAEVCTGFGGDCGTEARNENGRAGISGGERRFPFFSHPNPSSSRAPPPPPLEASCVTWGPVFPPETLIYGERPPSPDDDVVRGVA